MEYTDRIKILIFFISNFLDNIKDETGQKPDFFIDYIYLVVLDEDNNSNQFPYIKKAYDSLYGIIDNLKEDTPLYYGISQFNSIIYEELISKKILHSGAVLNVEDIKLELIRNINRFIFLSLKEDKYSEDHGEFHENSLSVIIYLLSFFKNIKDIYDPNYFDKAASVILILLLHENLGHGKKHTNNEKTLTPRGYINKDFNEILLQDNDTGDALEYLLIGDTFNLINLMNHENSIKLLNANLYVDKDFTELRNIYFSIEKDIEENNKNNKENEDKKEEDVKKGEKEEKGEKKENEDKYKSDSECNYEEEEEEEDDDENEFKQQIGFNFKTKEKQKKEKKGKAGKNKIKFEKNQNIIIDEINNDYIKLKYGNIAVDDESKKKIKKKKFEEEIKYSFSPKKKNLQFRYLKKMFGKMTEEQKEKMKDDENYKRYLKLLNTKGKKY